MVDRQAESYISPALPVYSTFGRGLLLLFSVIIFCSSSSVHFCFFRESWVYVYILAGQPIPYSFCSGCPSYSSSPSFSLSLLLPFILCCLPRLFYGTKAHIIESYSLLRRLSCFIIEQCNPLRRDAAQRVSTVGATICIIYLVIGRFLIFPSFFFSSPFSCK